MYKVIDEDLIFGNSKRTYFNPVKETVVEVYSDPASEGLRVCVYSMQLIEEGGEELLYFLGIK